MSTDAIYLQTSDAETREKRRHQYDFIENNSEIRQVVLAILNEYETVCVGVNQDLLSLAIVWAMRGDPLRETFSTYANYIDGYRIAKGSAEKPEQNAWSDCVDLARELELQKDVLNEALSQQKRRRLQNLRVTNVE